MENLAVALGTLLGVTLISITIVAGVWKFWRKSTIARIAQGFSLLSLGNFLTGDWSTAVGGFLLYGAIWFFAYRKMTFAEKIDYETFFRRK
jgi:hypothetical protein